MKRVAILFADGFEEVEAVTPLDFLRRAGIEVIAAGIGNKDIVGSHNIRIDTDMTVDELPSDLDGIVIPGGMPGAENIAKSAEAVSLIKKLFQGGKLVAAICAAPAVVLGGATDILSSRNFTCYPGFEKRVDTGTFREDRVVRDGNVITSRGAGTAAEFSVEVIRYLAGDESAEKVFTSTLQK